MKKKYIIHLKTINGKVIKYEFKKLDGAIHWIGRVADFNKRAYGPFIHVNILESIDEDNRGWSSSTILMFAMEGNEAYPPQTNKGKLEYWISQINPQNAHMGGVLKEYAYAGKQLRDDEA